MQQKWKRRLYLFFVLLSNYSSTSITVLTAYCSAMASKLRYDNNGIVGSDKQLGKHMLLTTTKIIRYYNFATT